MFDVFGDVKSLVKLESICIDNNVFRLHYKATFVILVLASLLVTSKQYIGDPIDCVVEEIPQNVRSNKGSSGNKTENDFQISKTGSGRKQTGSDRKSHFSLISEQITLAFTKVE